MWRLAAAGIAVRTYLTTLLWHEDRLSSLSSGYLIVLSTLCLAGLARLASGMVEFLEDLAFLLAENDFTMALIALQLLLISSAALWVLSCCLGALARRVLLYYRGL